MRSLLRYLCSYRFALRALHNECHENGAAPLTLAWFGDTFSGAPQSMQRSASHYSVANVRIVYHTRPRTIPRWPDAHMHPHRVAKPTSRHPDDAALAVSNPAMGRSGFQNESRNANCSRRGLESVAVEEISPNVGDPRVVFGSARLGVLVRLEVSTRNFRLMASLIGKALPSDNPGAPEVDRKRSCAVHWPRTRRVGGKAEVLNHSWIGWNLPVLGSPTWFGVTRQWKRRMPRHW